MLLHTLATIVFVNRYVSGVVVRGLRGARFDETIDTYEPTVTVVMPLFNEGAGVRVALASVLAQDYPAAKLAIVCVDDASTDDSHAHACAMAATDPRLTVVRPGTRHVSIEGVSGPEHEHVGNGERVGGVARHFRDVGDAARAVDET